MPSQAQMNSSVSGSYSEFGGRHLPVYFNKTDAGRENSKRSKQKNDCTVRAVATALKMEYDAAYDMLASAGRKCARGFDFKSWAKGRFEWISFPAEKGKPRMNPAKFCSRFTEGIYVLRTAGHVMTAIDGVIYDTSSPRPDRCIYGSWRIK